MEKKLSLGVSERDITPNIGGNLFGYVPDLVSTVKNDGLTATAYYFSDGTTEALMISTTVCLIATSVATVLRERISEQTKIPYGNIMIHATHTHSGPNVAGMAGWGDIDEEYLNSIYIPQVLKVAAEAKENAEPVTVALAQAESRIGINRRELTEEGEVLLGQNPWGPYDPKMTVIAFKNESGAIKATIVHYGCHGTAAGKNTEISRDWSGVMVDRMADYGGGVCAFFNGPEGDVGPRLLNGCTVENIGAAMTLSAHAAFDAVNIFGKIHGYRNVGLEVSNKIIRIPLDKRIPLDEAKREYEKYKDCTVNRDGGNATYLKKVIGSYADGYEEKQFREVEQTVIRIGEIAFVSFNYELFSEIGMRIQKDSPFPYTLSLSNTNGMGGYFVTEEEICRGGYEVAMFKQGDIQNYSNNADAAVVKQTLAHLREMKGEI